MNKFAALAALLPVLLYNQCARPLHANPNGCTPGAVKESTTVVDTKGKMVPFTTGAAAELVTCLRDVVPYEFTPVYSITLLDLKKGDTVLVYGSFEVTNESGYNVMVASQLRAGPSVVFDQTFSIDDADGTNVDPDRHHETVKRHGILTLTENTPSLTLTLFAWAATGEPDAFGSLNVEPGYGRLEGVVIR